MRTSVPVMRLEHAVDDAALEVAERRAGGRQTLAAQAVRELDEDALLVELDLELAELHLAEPVLERLDRVQLEVVAEPLRGEVDRRPGAGAEDLGQDRELQVAEERRGHARLGGRRGPHVGRRRPRARLLGRRQGEQAAQGAREDRRQRELLVGAHGHALSLRRTGAQAGIDRWSFSAAAAARRGGCLYYRALIPARRRPAHAKRCQRCARDGPGATAGRRVQEPPDDLRRQTTCSDRRGARQARGARARPRGARRARARRASAPERARLRAGRRASRAARRRRGPAVRLVPQRGRHADRCMDACLGAQDRPSPCRASSARACSRRVLVTDPDDRPRAGHVGHPRAARGSARRPSTSGSTPSSSRAPPSPSTAPAAATAAGSTTRTCRGSRPARRASPSPSRSQVVDELPCAPHDLTVDAIVTETRVIRPPKPAGGRRGLTAAERGRPLRTGRPPCRRPACAPRPAARRPRRHRRPASANPPMLKTGTSPSVERATKRRSAARVSSRPVSAVTASSPTTFGVEEDVVRVLEDVAVDERLHLRRDVLVVDGRGEQQAVGGVDRREEPGPRRRPAGSAPGRRRSS